MTQLDALTGIGPVYAQRIIDGRPYSSVDDLDRVKGIGPATLQKIKDQGLACVNCDTVQATPPPENKTPPATTSEQEYPSGVFINEILPNPAGSDSNDEWIELYNSTSSNVDLSGWQIQDTTGTVTTYTIPKNTNIPAGSFLVFKRPETKIMLNNDNDGVNLLTPDKKIADSKTFPKAPLGQSYNKINSAWVWSATLTPGAVNVAKAVTETLPKTQKSANNGSIEAKSGQTEYLTAGLSQPISSGTNPWPMFLIVLGSTIILAIIVLLIKFKLNKHVRT